MSAPTTTAPSKTWLRVWAVIGVVMMATAGWHIWTTYGWDGLSPALAMCGGWGFVGQWATSSDVGRVG